MGGIDGQTPAVGSIGRALHELSRKRSHGPAAAGQARAVDAGQEAAIVPGLDIQRGVERVGDQFSDRGNKIQLVVGGVLEEKLL